MPQLLVSLQPDSIEVKYDAETMMRPPDNRVYVTAVLTPEEDAVAVYINVYISDFFKYLIGVIKGIVFVVTTLFITFFIADLVRGNFDRVDLFALLPITVFQLVFGFIYFCLKTEAETMFRKLERIMEQ